MNNSQSFPRKKLILNSFGVFAASVIIVIFFLSIIPSRFRAIDSSDYLGFYAPVARNILNGSGTVLQNGKLAINYPPGFPLLLSGVFGTARSFGVSEHTAITLFILLCTALATLIIFLFSTNLWGILGGWISATLFVTYPLNLWLTKQPNSELPFMVFLYAGIYLFWSGIQDTKYRGLFFIFAGICIGFSMLIRPIAIGMGFLLVLLLFLSKLSSSKLKIVSSVIFLISMMAVVSPWEWHVYSHTDQVILLSKGSIPSIRDGLTFAVISKNYRTDISIPEDVKTLQQELAVEIPKMNSLSDIARALTTQIDKKPGVVIKMFILKAARSWYGTDSGNYEKPILLIQIFYTLLIVSSLIITWLYFPKFRYLIMGVGCIVCYFWMMTIIVLSISRYMVPVFGLLFLFPPAIMEKLRGHIPPTTYPLENT